jgi:hypothetical protein
LLASETLVNKNGSKTSSFMRKGGEEIRRRHSRERERENT